MLFYNLGYIIYSCKTKLEQQYANIFLELI